MKKDIPRAVVDEVVRRIRENHPQVPVDKAKEIAVGSAERLNRRGKK